VRGNVGLVEPYGEFSVVSYCHDKAHNGVPLVS